MIPLPRRPLDPSDEIRRWYENELGWPTVPAPPGPLGTPAASAFPVRLAVGLRFDVLDVPAQAGRAALRHLVAGSPVALRGDRMRLLVAAGSAEELPGVLDWLEWGTLPLDLTMTGEGGVMEAPLPPGPGQVVSTGLLYGQGQGQAVATGLLYGQGQGRTGITGPTGITGLPHGPGQAVTPGTGLPGGDGPESAMTAGAGLPGQRGPGTATPAHPYGEPEPAAVTRLLSEAGPRLPSLPGGTSRPGRPGSTGMRSLPLGRFGAVQGAAVWLRPPEPGCEVEPSLPTLSAMGGGGGAPDLVRVLDTVAAHCHRLRLRRACARPSAVPLAGH